MRQLKVGDARKVCESLQARQVVVVAFDGGGAFAVASYGETTRECAEVKPLCDDIAKGLMDGRLPAPG
jgi:hypothetical protein